MSILSILESVKWGIYIGSLKLILDYVREMFISHFIQPNFAYDMEKQRNILNAVGCYGQPTSFIPQWHNVHIFQWIFHVKTHTHPILWTVFRTNNCSMVKHVSI